MKYYLVLILVVAFGVFSCGGESEISGDDNTKTTDSLEVLPSHFESGLRPKQNEFAPSEIYVDTFVFAGVDANYDYWYAQFVLDNGDTAWVVTGDLMEEIAVNSIVRLEWKVDTFEEAGENDMIYLQESIVSYQVLEKGFDLDAELLRFYKASVTGNQEVIGNDFLHDDIAYFTAYNPGVACVLGGAGYEFSTEEYPPDMIIYQTLPEGDFCEGYEGAQDGMYYEEIGTNDLPVFADPSEEFAPITPQLPDLEIDKIYKVTVIRDEWHAEYLYFLKVGSNIYIWGENYCDCSA